MKRRIISLIVVVALVVAPSISSASIFTQMRWTDSEKAEVGALLACQAADVWTTFDAIDAGGYEVNPILPSSKSGILQFKTVATLAFLGLAHWSKTRRSRSFALRAGAFSGCVPAAWNVLQ